jgi:hypothetical protein
MIDPVYPLARNSSVISFSKFQASNKIEPQLLKSFCPSSNEMIGILQSTYLYEIRNEKLKEIDKILNGN